jgi:exonuclease VII small subunit
MFDIFDSEMVEDLNNPLENEDYLEAPRSRTVPDGFHVDTQLNSLPKEEKAFTDRSLTPDENALLNLEVTPLIEEVLHQTALDKGTIPESLVEDEIDDTYEPSVSEIDRERGLEQAIPFLDEYFSLSEKLERACLKFGWSELCAARDMAWSLFREEMEYNWLTVDRFDSKADSRLAELTSQGQEPDEKGWQKFLEKRGMLLQSVKRIERTRYNTTRSFYERAMELTKQCRDFWQTAEGKAINRIRQQRKDLFQTLVVKKEDGTCHWDYVRDYWNLCNEEISKDYLSTSDGAGVDDPNEILRLRDTATALAETYALEQMHQEKGDIYWEKKLGKWLDWSLDRARRAG